MDIETRAFKYQDSINRGGKGDHVMMKDAPAEPRSRSKKDTKKWCKGVVGREHKLVWVYRDLLSGWSFGRSVIGGVFKEMTIPELEEYVKPHQEMFRNRPYTVAGRAPSALQYCTKCQKQMGWGTNSLELRRNGITILTSLPAPE